ncbi:hypothetical protein Dimus_033563 [Dionaea muscipula]
MDLIKRQRWEKLFKRRELVHVDAVKEFYARLTLSHFKKKDVARSKVRGVEIEFDHMRLASILGIPGNNGICEYIKENVVPRFGKRDTTSYMDLIYMDHLIARRFVNLPRVMMRHMSYVISVKDHELPYGDWLTMVFEEFGVPLVDKKGEEPKRYDYFEETILTLCKLTRENRVWWIGTGDNRRRDDEIEAPAEEVHEEEEAKKDFDWEAVIYEAVVQGESGSDDQFFDAQVDVEELVTEPPAAPAFPASLGDSTNQQKEQTPAGVDPSSPSGHIPESVMIKLQAEFERAHLNRIQSDLEKAQAENARLLALLQQAQSKPKP